MSEIKQINTGVAELLAWLPPSNFTGLARIERDNLYYWTDTCTQSAGDYPRSIKLPFEAEILGIDTELTEEQCAGLVSKSVLFYHSNGSTSTTYPLETAKKTFASLLLINGCYSANPYRKPNPIDVLSIGTTKYHIATDQWQQDEANTGTWLILKRLS